MICNGLFGIGGRMEDLQDTHLISPIMGSQVESSRSLSISFFP